MSERCAKCPGTYACIKGNGPECNNYGLFIGEAPGPKENQKREVFCGPTGREVNEHYMPLAGIRRPNVRVVNAIQCYPDTPKHKLKTDNQDHLDLLYSCAEHHLYPEIERSRPKLLVPMGAFACRALSKDIDLDMHHGFPIKTDFGTAFPMWHPAGGIYEPKKMLQIRTDWARLRKMMSGTLTLPIDKYPDPDYQDCESPDQLDEYLDGYSLSPLATDTETRRNQSPHCATISIRPGTGRLIRVEDKRTLQRLNDWLEVWQGELLFHNWLFDAEVVEEMGLVYPYARVVDTMVRVFILGNLKQGLKSLAWRELGMDMQDFDDLVTPYSREIVLDYYRNAMCEEWSKPEASLVRAKGGGWKMYKPHGFKTKLKTFWTYYAKNPEKNVFEAWTKNWQEHHAEVEAVQGPWPGKCITHVPHDEVRFYACRDADATLRLWPIIRAMERVVRRKPQEQWRYAAA
jgi:uracil-DNA glycosylase family 4